MVLLSVPWIGVSADRDHVQAVGPKKPQETDFEEMVHKVEEGFLGHQSFQGVAMHNYDRYRRLAPDSARSRVFQCFDSKPKN